MHRIDHPTAVAALPTPDAAGTAGYFTDGDPVGGVPATVVTDDFLNSVMMEIVGVLTVAGITPSKTNNAQLIQALQQMFLGTGAFTDPGDFTLPGGLRVKFANGVTATGDQDQVTFAAPFPTNCLGVVANENSAAGWTISGAPQPTIHGTSARNAAGFKISSVRITPSGPAYGAGIGFFWIALGY